MNNRIPLDENLVPNLQAAEEHLVLDQAMFAYRRILEVIDRNCSDKRGINIPPNDASELSEAVLETSACLTVFVTRYFASRQTPSEEDYFAN